VLGRPSCDKSLLDAVWILVVWEQPVSGGCRDWPTYKQTGRKEIAALGASATSLRMLDDPSCGYEVWIYRPRQPLLGKLWNSCPVGGGLRKSCWDASELAPVAQPVRTDRKGIAARGPE
jgi:hypothetical protein